MTTPAQKFNEKVSRALWMSALGDAIGDPFEFDRDISNGDVENLIRSNEYINITDDTQMTLFGFNEIRTQGKNLSIDDIQMAYLDWYFTQTSIPDHSKKYVQPHLLSEELMYRRRAPGLTCLSALNCLLNDRPVENDSKGCGSVMRLLPFVYMIPMVGFDRANGLAIKSGLLTHKHGENIDAIELYMDFALACYSRVNGVKYNLTNLDYQLGDLIKYTSIDQIGTGWTAMECVKMAIWAVITSSSLEECMTKAIAHDGDSDSVAAVACGLYGLTDKVTTYDMALVEQLKPRLLERDIIESFTKQIQG